MKRFNRIKKIYQAAVDGVRPAALIQKHVSYDGGIAHVGGGKLTIGNNCHVVGFGKAVLSMAVALDDLFNHKISSGLLSVPHGSLAGEKLSNEFTRRICIREGAEHNLPDSKSLQSSLEICEAVKHLSEHDILFILISGGGSALLPLPTSNISLEDKQRTISLLSSRGAAIDEMNCVRKQLSDIKGGKLARLTYPAQTISLVLSDVIGDRLDIIASGPTVENSDPSDLAWRIVRKYSLETLLPASVLQVLKSCPTSDQKSCFDHVTNVLIGGNSSALEAAKSCVENDGSAAFIISDQVQGEAESIGRCFARLAHLVSEMLIGRVGDVSLAASHLHMDEHRLELLNKTVQSCRDQRLDLCLIAGGETTVRINGTGRGGRNQEMALACAIEMDSQQFPAEIDATFMSAGTDGIDGPTDAAGAVSHRGLVADCRAQGLDPASFLANNDSYNFYRTFNSGSNHVIVGHTGTNVMDICLMNLQWRDRPQEGF